MAKLNEQLQAWSSAGLITAEQAKAIAEFEDKERSPKSWVLFGVTGIGITAVAVGIVSIIASNWWDIPNAVKLGTMLLLLALLAAALFLSGKKQGLVRESLLCLLSLSTLGSIGLVGQVYNIQSDGWEGLLFWLVLVLPLTLLSNARLANHIWYVGLIVTTAVWFGAHGAAAHSPLPFALVFIVLGFGSIRPFLTTPGFHRTALFWSLALLLLFFIPLGDAVWREPRSHLVTNPFPVWISALAAGLAVRCSRYDRSLPSLKIMAFLLLALAAFLIAPPDLPAALNIELVSCLLFLAIWSLAAGIAAVLDRRRLFDFASVVIGIRLIVVYFQVFGSLARTGIGLIISGVLILLLAFVWHRYRRRVAKKVSAMLRQ